MFITKKVFDPALEGKAVTLSGSLIEGNFIIAKVKGSEIEVIGSNLKLQALPIEDFEHSAIEMKVLGAENLSSAEQPEKEPVKQEQKKRRSSRNRVFRTSAQMEKDNRTVEYILKNHGKPMKLEFVLRKMNELGHSHWSNNNASGFVKHAMNAGRKIYRVELGVYAYDWGRVR